MPPSHRSTASRRVVHTTLAVSLALASMVAGVAIPSRPVHAQGAGKVSMQDIHFAPPPSNPFPRTWTLRASR